MRTRPALALVVAAVVVAAGLPTAPASALTWEAGVVTGTGTISSFAATAAPRPATVSFTGTVTLIGTQPCSMSGPAAFESMEAGAGVLSGTCGTVPMSCLYERAGVAMTWECTTSTTGVLVGAFVYRPFDVNPTTSFDLTGVLAGVTSV